MCQVNAQDLVIGKDRNPSNCVFRVISKSPNGWLTCQLFCEQNGRMIPDGFICKFRTSDMMPLNGGAQ